VGKQCHKPSIWEWFIPPICGDLGGGLWQCFTHTTPIWEVQIAGHVVLTLAIQGQVGRGT